MTVLREKKQKRTLETHKLKMGEMRRLMASMMRIMVIWIHSDLKREEDDSQELVEEIQEDVEANSHHRMTDEHENDISIEQHFEEVEEGISTSDHSHDHEGPINTEARLAASGWYPDLPMGDNFEEVGPNLPTYFPEDADAEGDDSEGNNQYHEWMDPDYQSLEGGDTLWKLQDYTQEKLELLLGIDPFP